MANGCKLDEGVLSEVFGDDTSQVIQAIDSPREDKDIGAELDFETSKVRTILNDLLVKNLVQLNRKRYDTGYCDYSWVRREDKIQDYVMNYVDKRIKRLGNEIADADDIVFECSCRRIGYANAIEAGFRCADCGRTLRQVPATKGIRKIKAELKRLESIRNAS